MPEWLYNAFQSIFGTMYNYFYGKCKESLNVLFDELNRKVNWASRELATSPKSWNSDAFDLAESIAENTLMPIAGCIITFIFCWQLVHMMQENNYMQNIRPENILLTLIGLGLCMLACSKSFQIVMGFVEIGTDASAAIFGKSTVGTFGAGANIDDILPPITSDFTFGNVMSAMVTWMVLGLAKLLVYVMTAIVYIRINLWFIELLLYAAAAPIPLSTFGNKEWGQVGMNYVRKMLALSFEGFFMLLSFAMFGAVTSEISGGDFNEEITMILSAGIALCFIMCKAGNISASIFNAH